MGILDHRRVWTLQTSMSATQAIDAFVAAFDGTRRGPIISRAKWSVKRNQDGAIATYGGRGGVMAAVTMMSERASREQGSAVGSEIVFQVKSTKDGRTTCTMRLGTHGSILGFTADARFMRPYMSAVEDSFRESDPSMTCTRA